MRTGGLRYVKISCSEPPQGNRRHVAAPSQQLLSEKPPMPVSVAGNLFLESRYMKDAVLSILECQIEI
jgi:hypothetical protein